MAKRSADEGLEVKVRGGKLTISVGIRCLAFASVEALHRYDDGSGEYVAPRVLDADAFAADVVTALLDEEEDGSSAISRALDAAMQKARDDGSIAISEEEVEYEDAQRPWASAGIG